MEQLGRDITSTHVKFEIQNETGFDREIHKNVKYAIASNIHSHHFKDSIVCTSGSKYWEINFDPDHKHDTYMILTQSSKEKCIERSDGVEMENNKEIAFLFIIPSGLPYML